MNIYYVYVFLRERTTSNGVAGSPYYVGKGKNQRAYKKRGRRSCPAPKDHRYIIKVFENCSEDEALALEIGLISIFGRIDLGTGCLHNRTDGGDSLRGLIRTEDHKRKISETLMGHKHSAATKKKISEIQLGKTLTDAHKKNIKQAMKGLAGHPCSEELKSKYRELYSGKPKSTSICSLCQRVVSVQNLTRHVKKHVNISEKT